MPSEDVESIPSIGLFTQPKESYFEDPRFKAKRTREYGGNSLLNKGRINVFSHHPRTGQVWDVTRFIDGISISEDYLTPFTTIELSMINPTNVSRFVEPGMWISLHGPYYPNHGPTGHHLEIERGQIVSINAVIGDDKRISVLAKDPGWLIAKNRIPYRLPEGTLIDRLRFMEIRGYLTLDDRLPSIDYVLPSTRGGQESIWEDIMFDLGETNKVLKKKYVLRHRRGKFSIVDIDDQVRMWSFEIGSNVMNASKQVSIENFYNLIYVLGQEDDGLAEYGLQTNTGITLPVTGFAVDQSSITYMGQHILTVNEQLTTTTPDAQAQADELLEEYNKIEQIYTISTYSIPGIKWGDKVLVYEPGLDISGIFHVMSVQHQITNGSALMTLTVQYDSVAPDEIRKVSLEDMAMLLGTNISDLEFEPSDFATSE